MHHNETMSMFTCCEAPCIFSSLFWIRSFLYTHNSDFNSRRYNSSLGVYIGLKLVIDGAIEENIDKIW